MMSRGLGKIQQAILGHLHDAGRCLSCQDLADHIHGQAAGAVTRALDVSVRRAVKALARAGHLECGYLSQHPHQVLGCWLPGQCPTLQGKPAWEQGRLSLRAVEEVVLAVLQRITEEGRGNLEADGGRDPRRVRYGLLVREALAALGASKAHQAPARVAIGRAVRRLHRRPPAARGGARRNSPPG